MYNHNKAILNKHVYEIENVEEETEKRYSQKPDMAQGGAAGQVNPKSDISSPPATPASPTLQEQID